MFSLFFFSISHNHYSVYLPVDLEWEGESYEVCTTDTAEWVKDYVGENLYYSSYFLFRVFFVHLIPCILLVVLNIFLVRTLNEARTRQKMLNKKSKDHRSTTMMLVVIVTAFLIVEIPLAIITSLHVCSSLFNYNILDYRLANLGILFTNFFLILSYPINFTIYCGMSKQFRTTFVSLFCKGVSDKLNEITTIGGLKNEQTCRSRYSIINGNRTNGNGTTEANL